MAGEYFELQLKINPDIEDIVSDFCFENLHCEGVILAEETYKDLEMISTTEGMLKVFLPSEPENLGAVLNSERERLKSHGLADEELGSWDYVISKKPDEDWSKKWKEKWDVTHVSDRITVVPDWIKYSPKSEREIIIRLEPGCAFGTGTHATTQLCMKAIEKYMKPGSEIADIGTGSGILAICAMKLGAKSAYGCDNDETVIDVAKENAAKNGIPVANSILEKGRFGGCFFELNTAGKISRQFDFILANILHNVLVDIMGDLKTLMKVPGYLVLSGILDEKKPVVLEALEHENLTIIEGIQQNQWTALIVRN